MDGKTKSTVEYVRDRGGRALMDGFTEILESVGIDARVVGAEPMFDIVFTDQPVRDYRSARSEPETLRRYNALMRERGILKGENKFYISAAHTEDDVAITLNAFAETVEAISAPTRGE